MRHTGALFSFSCAVFAPHVSTSAFSFGMFGGGGNDEADEIGTIPTELDVYVGHEIAEGPTYGADLSFAIFSDKISDNYAWLPHNADPKNHPTVPDRYVGMPVQILGDKQTPYDELVEGCVKHYEPQGSTCRYTEQSRIEMNVRQPKSMQNYTDLGFKKIRTPPEVFKLVKEFWERNKDNKGPENWGTGNTYTNHWKAPTHMVSVENTGLRGGGQRLKQKIWDSAKETLEQWTGERLTPCSLYGIRVYTEGAVLATHVDRLPLVSSAIVNVAQDVDEPWPLEVYGHDGRSYNITMEPGDMVLYESHSVLHGRPFPLKGRYYANIFIHFEPVGHTLRHHAKAGVDAADTSSTKRRKARVAGHESHSRLPSYIKPDTEEAQLWEQSHGGKKWAPTKKQEAAFSTGSTDAHSAAQKGEVRTLAKIAGAEASQLTKKDSNGWEPIHEGARGGHKDVLDLLIKHGANINERTNHGKGGSPLYLAKQAHGKHHPSVKFLEEMGAEYIEPEL